MEGEEKEEDARPYSPIVYSPAQTLSSKKISPQPTKPYEKAGPPPNARPAIFSPPSSSLLYVINKTGSLEKSENHEFQSVTKIMAKERKAYFCAIVAVLLWSTVASAFKISLRYLDVLSLLFYAAITSSIILFCFLLFFKKLNLLRVLSRKDYLHSALLALLNPFLYYLVLFKAYSILPAQQALTLNFTWPIMLVLLSIPLLGQKIKLRSVLAIIISFFGVLLIATQGDIFGLRFTSVTGVSLAVASSLIWALFWIYTVKDRVDEIVRLFLNFTFGSCFIFLAMLLFSKPQLPSFNAIPGAIYIGLFEMGITFLVWLKALKLSKTTAYVANLIYLTPFLSIVVIHFVIGEKILLSTVIGLILIVTGIILHKLRPREALPPKLILSTHRFFSGRSFPFSRLSAIRFSCSFIISTSRWSRSSCLCIVFKPRILGANTKKNISATAPPMAIKLTPNKIFSTISYILSLLAVTSCLSNNQSSLILLC